MAKTHDHETVSIHPFTNQEVSGKMAAATWWAPSMRRRAVKRMSADAAA